MKPYLPHISVPDQHNLLPTFRVQQNYMNLRNFYLRVVFCWVIQTTTSKYAAKNTRKVTMGDVFAMSKVSS